MTSDVIHRLKQILGKYEQVRGIQVWGSEDSTPTGTIHVVRVDANGRLEIVGVGGAPLAVDIVANTIGLATEVTLAAQSAAQATAVNQTTMITALQLIDDLRDALNSVAIDELRVLISDPTTPANRARVLTATDQDTPDLDDELLQTCHALLIARLDVNTTKGLAAIDIGTTYGLGIGIFDAAGNRMPTMDAIGRAGYQYITDGVLSVDVLTLARNMGLGDLVTDNHPGIPTLIGATSGQTGRAQILTSLPIVTGSLYSGLATVLYAFPEAGGIYHQVLGMSGTTSRDLNVRIGDEANATALWASVVTDCYANLTTENPLVTTGVIQGEDLEVGAGNSEPAKIRVDDGSLPEGEKHLVVLCLNLVKDGNAWVPMTQPS